jgi:hypothetical protein
MSIAYNATSITNGIVLYVDAANVKSYPGTGNSVYDLSNYSSGISFYNSPVITNKAFDFTSLDTDGLSISSTNYAGLINFTMESLFSLNGTHLHYDGTLLSSGDWNTTHWSFGINQSNTAISTRNPYISHAYTFNIGSWYHVVYRRAGTLISTFVNGVKLVDQTVTGFTPLTSGASNTAIGRETYAGGYFNLNGKIAMSRIYNRDLSDEEVRSNFNSLRGRYSI